MNKQNEIKFSITLDEKNVPETIIWEATDADKDANEKKECKSIMISIWDRKERNTLRIDLWTKDMGVDEMHAHFFQTLVTMAESFQKATGNNEILTDMQEFCDNFSKKTPFFQEKPS